MSAAHGPKGVDVERERVSDEEARTWSAFSGVMGNVHEPRRGWGGMVRDVAAMPGVESIKINSQANQTLASVAVDPEQPKVGATTPQTRDILQDTAKG